MAGVQAFWRVADLTPEDLDERPFRSTNRDLVTDDVEYVRLIRPSYQRSLVWKRERAEEFMESLSKGYPFGVLVLAHDGVSDTYDGMDLQHHTYRIIDGQQRIYWLNQMRERFFVDGWFLKAEQDLGELEELARRLLVELSMNGPHTDAQLVALLKTVMANPSATNNPLLLLREFISASGAPPPVAPEELERPSEIATELWQRLMRSSQTFRSLPVPVLIIGTQLAPELPDVFVKLNSGLRLSRFDIFAAQWAMVTLDLEQAVSHPSSGIDQSLADSLIRYSQARLEEGDVEESDYEVELADNESVINLYEYLYALSRIVAERYPSTIGSISKAAEELVLNVAAILFCGDVQRMEQLVDRYPQGTTGELDFELFPAAVLKAAEAVDDALKPLLVWDLGSSPTATEPRKRRSVPTALGLLQVAAYMSAFIVNMYDVKARSIRVLPAGSAVSSRISRYKKALRTWYLHDAVTSPFKGSEASTNISVRVWSNFSQKQPNADMTSPVPLGRLSELVKRYVEDSLIVDATPANRTLSQPGAGALLRLIYTGQTPNSDEDRDHVVPVAVFRVLDKAPGSHVANWMPLNKSDNRRRGSALWADCWGDRAFDPHRAEIERHLFVPPLSVDDSVVESTEAFVSFLRRRFNAMTTSLATTLAHPDESNVSVVADAFVLPQT
jgi:hypothetical protein